MDGGRKSGPGNAETDVHPPRFAIYRRTVDAESGQFPQAEVNQQHFGQARICKYPKVTFHTVEGPSLVYTGWSDPGLELILMDHPPYNNGNGSAWKVRKRAPRPSQKGTPKANYVSRLGAEREC